MKSKFTSVLMFFIILFIIGAMGLLGSIVWTEIQNFFMADNYESKEMAEYYQSDEDWGDISEKSVEVPKIRNTTKNSDSVSTASNPLTELSKNKNTQEKSSIENIEETTNKNISIVNKHFYGQLNNYSKIIYQALENNKENMKSGTYRVNLGTAFSDILTNSNGQEVLGKYYQSAIEAYIYDNPDVFYLSPSKMYLNMETTTRGNKKTYNTFIDNGNERNYLINEFNSEAEVNEALRALEGVKTNMIARKTGDTYKDVKMVHDFLVNNIEYDRTVSKANIYNIYGALINNKCVCEGYAKAFKYLLDGMGIESIIVTGKATNPEGGSENHAWNYVNLDGNWYAVDSTWDDPIIIGGGTLSNSAKYRYFLKGSQEMNKDHTPYGKFTEEGMVFEYPRLSNNNY